MKTKIKFIELDPLIPFLSFKGRERGYGDGECSETKICWCQGRGSARGNIFKTGWSYPGAEYDSYIFVNRGEGCGYGEKDLSGNSHGYDDLEATYEVYLMECENKK